MLIIMNLLISLVSLLSLIAIGQSADGFEWSYEDQDHWPEVSATCAGNRQSPIDISRKSVYLNYSLDLQLINYHRSNFGYTINNDGHAVRFDFVGTSGSAIPYLTGSVVDHQVFRLAQFHSHWGPGKFYGSEHTIDGRSYPFETHFVHYNLKYPDLGSALGQPDGVAVLGVFHQPLPNPHLAEIVNLVEDVSGTITTKPAKVPFSIRLADLLPANTKKFYTYSGSLTTPPCTENVRWIVLDHSSFIGYKQLEAYRRVIERNFRSTQPLGRRIVQSSFNTLFSFAESQPEVTN